MMRIALLGVDDTSLAIALAASRSNEFEIVLIDATAARSKEAMSLAPRAAMFTEWETLLSGNTADVVVVAADEPEVRLEQLRRLVQLQGGAMVLVSHPISLSMLQSYELEMIREESAAVVAPYLPARLHPAIEELGNLIDEGGESEIGAVEQITLQRKLVDRDRPNVLRQFARDVDVLQVLSGNTVKLHAFASGGGESFGSASRGESASSEANVQKTARNADLKNLVVQTTSQQGLICRWTVVPASDRSSATLTMIGSLGEANLQMADDEQPWRLEVRSSGGAHEKEFLGWNAAAAMLDEMAHAKATSGECMPSWADASRTIELTETIDRSLARGRTIELHDEEFSDINTFKGTMTSVGCGLLVAGMVLLFLVASLRLVAVHAGWNQLAALLDNWPYLLLVVCGIYLMLQLLVFVGKPRQKQDADTPNEPNEHEKG